MAVVKWEPWDDLDRWFFNDMMPSVRSKVGWDLSADVYEEGDSIVAEMTIPGMDGDKINVAVRDGHLHISGSREETSEKSDKQYYAKEIRRGSFQRSIRLPSDVDKKNVNAQYQGGVLKVTMPKADQKEGSVKVEVKS